MSNIKRTMAGRNKQRSAGQTHRGDSFRLAASGDTTDGTKRNVSLFAHDATGLEWNDTDKRQNAPEPRPAECPVKRNTVLFQHPLKLRHVAARGRLPLFRRGLPYLGMQGGVRHRHLPYFRNRKDRVEKGMKGYKDICRRQTEKAPY